MTVRHRPNLQQLTLHDDFWTPYLEKIRTVMVPHVLNKMEDVGYLDNFRYAAQGTNEHKGPPFSDGLLLETIRGISDFLAVYPDSATEKRLDEIITVIVAAQADDGFLCTQTQCCYPDKRWGENGGDIIIQHDLYDQGALIEAGVHHYLATGKTALLACAVRSACGIVRYIGPSPKANRIPGHSLPEEAMVKLYRLFRDHGTEAPISALAKQYAVEPLAFLEIARFWYDGRGKYEGRTLSWDKRFTPPYNQDHLPFVEQREAVGHAVRAMLCYTGAAVVEAETGAGYRPALAALWDSVTQHKMHISGGIGTRHDIEGFDHDYNLPNDAYLETCAGVGLAFWSGEMALLERNAAYFDTFEQALYNNVLASIGEDGKRYFYENPLVSDGSKERWEWHGCPCCPPMLLKLFSFLSTYIYTVSGDTYDVNLYVGSTYVGESMTIAQQDGYIRADSHGKSVKLCLRIPAYATQFTINGEAPDTIEGGYAVFTGVFTPDRPLHVQYATPIRRIQANPAVEADKGRVAVMRGQWLYCAEGIDNETVDLTLPSEPSFQLQADGTTIKGKTAEGKDCTLVPYYRWNNRGASPMQVWFTQIDADTRAWHGELYRTMNEN